MSRPKRVNPKKLSEYNLMHTRKSKMYCGTEITGLHLVKETSQFYVGFETWSHCIGPFKKLKFGTQLDFNIPVVTNDESIKFLNKNAWHDWVARELVSDKKKGEMGDTISFLDKLFSNKKKIYFYELESFVTAYCHGTFLSYDDNGNIEDISEHQIKQRKYYTGKYYRSAIKESKEVKALYDAYEKVCDSQKEIKDKAFTKYYEAKQNYIFEHYNLTDTFIDLSRNAVVCPYAFGGTTVKGMSYEHAGEIYFIVTPDAVYFEIKRHF